MKYVKKAAHGQERKQSTETDPDPEMALELSDMDFTQL